MTLFLASVRDAEEAELALGAGADIVDLKDPGQGALGALAPDTIAACVRHVAGRAPVSATIGDRPLEGDERSRRGACDRLARRRLRQARIFPGGDAERCLKRLADDARQLRLILVLFADALPAFDASSSPPGSARMA